MYIMVDTREKPKEVARIVDQFTKLGIRSFRSKAPVGDYIDIHSNKMIVVDRKKDLQELCGNVIHEHDRFTRELKLAKELGYKMYVLCEHGDPIHSLPDVAWWVNPRIKESPKATKGETLYKSLCTIEKRYGCKFVFCNKGQTGRKIIEILKGEYQDE